MVYISGSQPFWASDTLFWFENFAAHICLIKSKILVLLVIIDEISIVFTCFLVYFKTWRHTLNNSTAHRLRNTGVYYTNVQRNTILIKIEDFD